MYKRMKICWISILWVSSVLCADPGSEDEWIDPLDLFSHDPTTVERDYNKFIEGKNKDLEPTVQDVIKSNPTSHDTNIQVDNSVDEKSSHDSQHHKPKGNSLKAQTHHAQCPCKEELDKIKNLEKQISKKPAEHGPYFKQYVARVVRLLDQARQVSYTEAASFSMDVVLYDADIEVLRKFATGPGEGTVQNAHSVLEGMYRTVRQVDIPEGTVTDWKPWILTSCWVVTAFASSCIAINLQWRFGIPWGRLIGSVFVVLFLVSIPWTWWRLYQEEIVKRMASVDKQRPPECDPDTMTTWQSLWSSLSMSDKCEKFYASLHIDPWMDVTPTKALVVTLAKFVLDPLQYLGEAISKMVVACLQDLPGHLWPIALSFLIFICLMLLIMFFGYRINLCYLIDLAPYRHALPASDRRLTDQIEAQNEQVHRLTEGINNLQIMFNEQKRTLDEQLGQPQLLALPSIRPGELTAGSTATHPDYPPPLRGPSIPQAQGPPTYGRLTDRQHYRPHRDEAPSYTDRMEYGDHADGDRVEEIEVEKPPPAIPPRNPTLSLRGPNIDITARNKDSLDSSGSPAVDEHSQEQSDGAPCGVSDGNIDAQPDVHSIIKTPSTSINTDSQLPAGQEADSGTADVPPLVSQGKTEDNPSQLSQNLNTDSQIMSDSFPTSLHSSFDSLIQSTAKSISASDSALNTDRVEEIGTSVLPQIAHPADSSDDSDLEIIEEEPEKISSL